VIPTLALVSVLAVICLLTGCSSTARFSHPSDHPGKAPQAAVPEKKTVVPAENMETAAAENKDETNTAHASLLPVPNVPAKPSGFRQTGTASYYALKFHGRRTASGERYDRGELTAAHPRLPFGTMVKVTNLSNKKAVVVRINDRGPHTKKRVIDISFAAAKRIGIVHSGTARVLVEVVR
jgi:rare lipoprotein A